MVPKSLLRITLITMVVAIAALAWSPRMLVAGEPVGEVFTITRGGGLPALASLPESHRFLVVWDMGLVTLDGTSLRARFVDGSGQFVGPDFAPTAPGGRRGIPSVTANPLAEEFLVTWWDARPDRLGDIYGQRLDADGRLVGEEVFVAHAANFENWPPAVAHNAVSDEYLIVWYEDRGEPGESNIYGQRLASNGELIGGVFLINDEGTPQVRPAVAANSGNGEYLAVWSLIGPDLSANLFGQRLTATGERIGEAIPIGPGDKPAITYNRVSGEYLVARANGLAQAERLRPDGSVIQRINLSAPGGSLGFSDAASDSAGGYLAVWDGPGNGNSGLSVIFGGELSPDGELRGRWALGSPPSRQMYPTLAYNPQANIYLAAWEEWVAGEQMVRGRIYKPGEPPPPAEALFNGDFEDGFYPLGGQSIANGWAPYTLLGQPSFAGERSTVHSGRWAYKVSGHAPFTAGLAQVVQVQPGKTYRVTAYYQLYPPGDGAAFLGVRDDASTTQWIGDSWPGVWRPLSQAITVTSGQLTVTLQGSSGADPNTNVYFDDVTVVAVGGP